MLIALSLLVALIGMLAYALSANPKIAEIGRISFFAGLFVFLLCFCEHGERLIGVLPR